MPEPEKMVEPPLLSGQLRLEIENFLSSKKSNYVANKDIFEGLRLLLKVCLEL